MLTMLRRLIGENVELVWLPGKALARVNMDPSQLDQVLVHLCINARDAIDGTGRITIETASASFDDAVPRTKQCVKTA
jgi:signal transduction histidine kinase